MNQYIIEKTIEEKSVVSYKEKDGVSFSPKKTTKMHHVKRITVIDAELIEKMIMKKIDKEYKRILSIIYSIMNSDDSNSGDILVAYTEIQRLENIILAKYKKALKKEVIEKYLKKLKILEIELQKVQITMQQRVVTPVIEEDLEERKGKGR